MRRWTLFESGVRLAGALLAAATSCALVATGAAADPSRAPMLAVWRVDKANGKANVAGSGFLIGASGHILTARHVADHNPYEALEVSIGSRNANRLPVLPDVRCHD